MDIAGTQIYFVMIALIHALLVGLALVWMSVRAAVPVKAQGPFITVPEVGTAVSNNAEPGSGMV